MTVSMTVGAEALPTPPVPEAFKVSVREALGPALWLCVWFSLLTNLLMLVSPIYMLQIYDRVLVSGSSDTLIWLSIIAVFLLLIYAAAESGRRRVMTAGGARLEQVLTGFAFERFRRVGDAQVSSNLNAISRVNQLFSGQSLLPLFDLPFAPLFLALLFFMHPVLGAIGLAGAAAMMGLAIIAEITTRKKLEAAQPQQVAARGIAAAMDRDRNALVALGMGEAVSEYQRAKTESGRLASRDAANNEGSYSGFIKSSRQSLQVIVLGIGAALALGQEISPGMVIAGSIILSRVLAPIDQIASGWRHLTMGRSSWKELTRNLGAFAEGSDATPLPVPEARIELDHLEIAQPASEEVLLRPFSLRIEKGTIVTLVGPVGSGKTTLLHTLGGIQRPKSGSVMLGGANVHDWPSGDRGRHVGYVPQRVDLLPGTLKQNVARFLDVDDKEIYSALQMAGATELVMAMPKGLDTEISLYHTPVSAGQAQLIGLARALLTDPKVLFLDEPTANLDPQTARHFTAALREFAREGRIVIAATHDLRLVQACDSVLILQNGHVDRKSPKDFLEDQRAAHIRLAATQEGTT